MSRSSQRQKCYSRDRIATSHVVQAQSHLKASERGTTRTRHSPAVKGSLRRAQLVAAPCRRALLLLYPQVEPARECEEAREVHRGERRPRHERSWEGKGAARQREEDGGGLVRVRVRVANPNPNPNSKPKPNPNPNSNQGRPGGVEHCEGA